MSKTVTVQVDLGRSIKRGEEVERVPRVARLLALAHKWDALIKDGDVRDRAELARLVGVSRAKVSQVMALLWLAPAIQEAVLAGDIDGPRAERRLRRMAKAPTWVLQTGH